MARRIINTGNVANDNTGDSLRVAFTKANDNFTELFTFLNSNIGDISSNGTLLIAGTLTSTGNTYVRTNGFYLQDSNDFSKQARFKISDYPNGTISTLTLPSGTTSLLSPESVASLSNKIIDGTVNTLRNIPLGNANVTGTLAVTRGGTGVSTAPDVGQVLIGTGTGFKLAQLTPGEGITIDNSNPGAITISGSQALNAFAIQDIVQQMFSENESEGISESFDPTNRKINLFANDFSIILDGDVTGSNVVHSLSDIRITTTAPNLLKGVTTSYNGYPTGDTQSVRQLNFTGPVQMTQSGDVTTIAVNTQLSTQDVRDIIGNTVTSSISESNIGNTYTDSGIIVLYDKSNNSLRVSPRDFNVNLTGVITGTGTSHRLQDITINTATTSLITGLTGYANGVITGTSQSVKGINFVGNLGVTQTGSNLTVTLPSQLQTSNVRDIIGSTIQAGYLDANSGIYTDSGIVTTYVSQNNAVYLAPRDFYVNIAGDIVGSAQVTHLRDTTITVSSPTLIKGITTKAANVATGSTQSVTNLNFTGCVSVNQSGNLTTVNIPQPLQSSNVRDIIGSTIQAGYLGANSGIYTDSGIVTTYVEQNNAVYLAPRDFYVNITGDVIGSAQVTHLRDTTINVSSPYLIRGMTTQKSGFSTGNQQSVGILNFTGNVDVSQSGNITTINVPTPLSSSNVQDIIGTTVQGTIRDSQTNSYTNSGIIVLYDAANKYLSVAPRDFTVTLAGEVSGSATISRLGNATIQTTTTALKGINTQVGGVGTGTEQTVKTLNFTGCVNVSQSGNVTTINVPTPLNSSNVQDIIGSTVYGSIRDSQTNTYTDSGIIVLYDSVNKALSVAPRDFTVTLTGDVSGTTTISRLGNASIQTTTTAIKGLTTQAGGVGTGLDQTVKTLNFTGCVNVSQSGNVTTINVPVPLSSGGVRDIIGSTIQGTIRDSQTNTNTDSGIIVIYDAINNTLQLAPRDFTVTLAGDVNGTATISRLGNTTIQTTTTAIKGITVKNDNTLAGYSGNIKSLNFIGASSITVDNAGQANVTIPSLNSSQVAPLVGSMLSGTQYGVNATYNSTNKNIDFSLKPIKISLAGAINGTGNITFNGGANDGVVTINTTGGTAGSGLVVADEYNVTGAVNEINFVGGGVTTAISIDGQVATVYVPNSPAAENFILATAGSENVQNARRFAAGTGIAITDEGPGGKFIVSAVSDALLAKTQYYTGNVAVGQEIGLDVRGSQDMVVQAIDDPVNKKVIYTVYSIEDGWYRQSGYDCGVVTDKYGGSLDMGDFSTKIINYAADLGTL